MAPAEPAAADTTCIALSFNGRTSDSDSLDRGSNPWGATNQESFTCLVCHTASRSNAMQRVTASAFTEDSKCPRAMGVPVYYLD